MILYPMLSFVLVYHFGYDVPACGSHVPYSTLLLDDFFLLYLLLLLFCTELRLVSCILIYIYIYIYIYVFVEDGIGREVR